MKSSSLWIKNSKIEDPSSHQSRPIWAILSQKNFSFSQWFLIWILTKEIIFFPYEDNFFLWFRIVSRLKTAICRKTNFEDDFSHDFFWSFSFNQCKILQKIFQISSVQKKSFFKRKPLSESYFHFLFNNSAFNLMDDTFFARLFALVSSENSIKEKWNQDFVFPGKILLCE